MVCNICHFRTVILERQQLGLKTCLHCAQNVPRYKGSMTYEHKTAGELNIMLPKTFNVFKKISARNNGKNCNLGKTMKGAGVTEILIDRDF